MTCGIYLNAKNYFYPEKILIRRVRQGQLHELYSIWVPEQINPKTQKTSFFGGRLFLSTVLLGAEKNSSHLDQLMLRQCHIPTAYLGEAKRQIFKETGRLVV